MQTCNRYFAVEVCILNWQDFDQTNVIFVHSFNVTWKWHTVINNFQFLTVFVVNQSKIPRRKLLYSISSFQWTMYFMYFVHLFLIYLLFSGLSAIHKILISPMMEVGLSRHSTLLPNCSNSCIPIEIGYFR